MEFMVAGGEANTIDTSHKCFCRSAGLFFFCHLVCQGGSWLAQDNGGRRQCQEGEGVGFCL